MAGNPALRNYALSALILTFLGLSGQFVRQPTHSAAPSGPGAPIPARVTSDVCEDPTITSLEAFYNAKEPRTWWYMRPLNHFMPPEFNHEHIRTIYNIMMQPVGTERADARGWPRNDFLEEAIKDHIGVFQDPPAPGQTTPAHLSFDPKLKPADEATRRKFSNAVFLISANYGYLDFIMNFICNTRAMANYKPLLVAQDNSLHTHITERKLPIASFLGSHINVSSFSRATNFYEGSGFARVSMMKVISVRAILESGRDVMFSDVDIAFAREPLQYFKGDVDFEFQSNHWMPEFMSSSEPNTGFYMMRSNPRTIRFLWETEKYCDTRPGTDDQTCAGEVLRLWTQTLRAVYVPLTVDNVDAYLATIGYCRERVFTFRQLHPTRFPPGFLYFFNLKNEFHKFIKGVPKDILPATMHANYVAGHDSKKSALQESGLWVYAEDKAKDGPKGAHSKLVCEGDDE